eukprot:12312862-Heterocapsa_arctica.AAC.1
MDRTALMTIIKDIPHGTMIGFDVIDDLKDWIDDNKTFNMVSLIALIMGDYMSDVDWNFLVIGKDERALELNDDTEVVYGVVSLGEAGECLDQYGTSETHFQQVRSGEIRGVSYSLS